MANDDLTVCVLSHDAPHSGPFPPITPKQKAMDFTNLDFMPSTAAPAETFNCMTNENVVDATLAASHPKVLARKAKAEADEAKRKAASADHTNEDQQGGGDKNLKTGASTNDDLPSEGKDDTKAAAAATAAASGKAVAEAVVGLGPGDPPPGELPVVELVMDLLLGDTQGLYLAAMKCQRSHPAPPLILRITSPDSKLDQNILTEAQYQSTITSMVTLLQDQGMCAPTSSVGEIQQGDVVQIYDLASELWNGRYVVSPADPSPL